MNILGIKSNCGSEEDVKTVKGNPRHLIGSIRISPDSLVRCLSQVPSRRIVDPCESPY